MLGTLETQILMAIIRKGQDAYGVAIAGEIEKRTGQRHSLGAIYTTLERLTAKRFVSSHDGEATLERGGRKKTYFRLTNLGEAELDASLKALGNLSRGNSRLRGALA